MKTSRREFIRRAAGAAGALTLAGTALDRLTLPTALAQTRPAAKECLFYDKGADRTVTCTLCPHACDVGDGQRGACGVRENRGGVYRTLVYGRWCSLHIDPIEKKPFYHYLPGTQALSVATAGCNMTCKFCQNHEISQARPEKVRHRDGTPKQLIDLALARKVPTVAYTYSEPTIFYEYMHDTAKEGRPRRVGSVMVSNGFINAEPMRQLARHLTAVKVDLKAFTDKFYRDVCGGALQPVLDNLKVLHAIGIHLELVVLLVPTLNDGADEIKRMAAWVVKELGPDVPMHFSRFHPTYKMQNLPRTPVKTIETARDVAVKEGVHYAYVGNVPFHDYGNTTCHKCKTTLIERVGFRLVKNVIADGKCPKCGTKIPGVWSQEKALAFKPKT